MIIFYDKWIVLSMNFKENMAIKISNSPTVQNPKKKTVWKSVKQMFLFGKLLEQLTNVLFS